METNWIVDVADLLAYVKVEIEDVVGDPFKSQRLAKQLLTDSIVQGILTGDFRAPMKVGWTDHSQRMGKEVVVTEQHSLSLTLDVCVQDRLTNHLKRRLGQLMWDDITSVIIDDEGNCRLACHEDTEPDRAAMLLNEYEESLNNGDWIPEHLRLRTRR